MIELGKKQKLSIVKKVEFGAYLGTEEEKVLLPIKQIRTRRKRKMNKFWSWKNKTVTNQETQTQTTQRTLFLNRPGQAGSPSIISIPTIRSRRR